MQENQKKQNPLMAFFRQPRIYIELPSKGKFYPEGSIEYTQNGEYPVYAMTAKDELMFKTPDALMNGSSTVEVIRSCVPNIKDPWEMPSIDLDAVLCAIRMATYGHEMAITNTCPSCGHLNERAVDLRVVYENLKNITFSTEIKINNDLLIHVKPLNYKEVSKASLKAFEHQRIFSIVNDTTIPDDEKIKMFQETFLKLTDLTLDTIAESISAIDSSNGSTDDPEFIKEFLKNSDKSIFEAINKSIEASKEKSKIPALDTKCDECGHEFKISITIDQSDFFAKGF